jgi:hypothetical protein
MSDLIWSQLSQADYYRYSSEFMHLPKGEFEMIWGEQFIIFMQWVLEFNAKETIKARSKGRVTQLITVPSGAKNKNQKTIFRIYSGNDPIPANSLREFFEITEDRNFEEVCIVTMGFFTDRQIRYNRGVHKPMTLIDRNQFLKLHALAKKNFIEMIKKRKGKTVGKGLLGLINRPNRKQ